MGYGVSAQDRRALEELNGSRIARPDAKPPDAIVVDLNATLRFCIVGGDRNSLSVALALLRRVCGGTPACALYIVADNPLYTHEARRKLHSSRYPVLTAQESAAKEAAGFKIVNGRAFKPDETPLTPDELSQIDTGDVYCTLPWSRLMQSARGKHIAVKCVMRGLMHAAQSSMYGDAFKLFLWHDGEPYTFPRVWPRSIVPDICDNRYGEADQRVTEAVRAIQAKKPDVSIWIWTIDTDMLIQSIVAPLRTEGHLTLFLKNETVDLNKWRQGWGATDDIRASSAFFLLLAGGCDYNSGFTPFGYFKKDIFIAARKATQSEPFIRLSRDDDALSLNLGKFRRALKNVLRKRPKKRPRDTYSIETEISNAAFTIALFSGIKRHTGGPPLAHFSFLDGVCADCDPIEGLFSAQCEFFELEF